MSEVVQKSQATRNRPLIEDDGMTRTERIARAIKPDAWRLHDFRPEHREVDPFHASDLDMSIAAAKRVEVALAFR